jgi:hypothetical protein
VVGVGGGACLWALGANGWLAALSRGRVCTWGAGEVRGGGAKHLRDQWQGLPCWCWRRLLVQLGKSGGRWAGQGLDELVHASAPPGQRDVVDDVAGM